MKQLFLAVVNIIGMLTVSIGAASAELTIYSDGSYYNGGTDSTFYSSNIVAGYQPSVAAGIVGATISGGGAREVDPGFFDNLYPNTVAAHFGTVSGGYLNTASGNASVVSGGKGNTASGTDATVAGGTANTASGNYSFAAGCTATAAADGSFMWADSNCDMAAFPNSVANSFYVRASGGAVFRTNPSGGAATGVQLAAGGGSWSSLSDVNAKENFESVDPRKILEKLAGVPVKKWNLRSQPSATRHIGPTAQDFHAAFGLGEDERYINSSDADGISLAAIQGLYQIVRDQERVIQEKDRELQIMTRAVLDISSRLAVLESSGKPVAAQ